MLAIPSDLAHLYEMHLAQQGVAVEHRPHYKKRLRYYWDFCHKYALEPRNRQSKAKGARLTLHLTIRALALCLLHPRPATGLGLASMPTHSLDRIQELGVTQRLTLTQKM